MTVSARIAVIGVGDEFRRDDGVGPAVIARLEERAGGRPLPPRTALAVCDGEPGGLLGLWESTDLAVVVDAAHAKPAHPGRVHRLELDRHALWQPGPVRSHGLSFGEAVELARALGRLPGRLVVYAVEGADNSLGTGLTAPVAAVVGPVAESIEADIVRHRDAAARGALPRR